MNEKLLQRNDNLKNLFQQFWKYYKFTTQNYC